MKAKNITILITILVVLAAGSFTYYYKDAFLEKTTALTLENIEIKDNAKPFDITINYPQISGQDDFNGLVKNIADKELSEFKQISLENDQAVKEIDPESYERYPRSYYLGINYDKGQIDEDTTSIVFNIENFTGGAHGAHYPIAINYNVKDKKEIKLSDLYKNQPDYLQKISDFCKTELTKQIIERAETIQGSWIEDGAGPDEKNYSVFLINKDKITFYFSEYQVAAYALGSFKVEMPR